MRKQWLFVVRKTLNFNAKPRVTRIQHRDLNDYMELALRKREFSRSWSRNSSLLLTTQFFLPNVGFV